MRIETGIELLFFVVFCASANAADLSGTWQGADKHQHVLKITKIHGRLHGELYNLGQEQGGDLNGNPVSFVVTRRSIKFSNDRNIGSFEGLIAADNNSMSGTFVGWTGNAAPITFVRAPKHKDWVIDPSPHQIRFITADTDVQLEVLDWGGSGPPLILLSGLGNTAHVFDTFALNFTSKYHVYGLTRRGFGLSSSPAPTMQNYDANRLGDDVIAVMDALKIGRAFLAGHSIGGEELSSVATRSPQRVLGLIYLDAAYTYAFYSAKSLSSVDVDSSVVGRDLLRLRATEPSKRVPLIVEIQATLPTLQRELEWSRVEAGLEQDWPDEPVEQTQEFTEEDIAASERRYTGLTPPILAIYALPRQCAQDCNKIDPNSFEAAQLKQIAAVEADYPSASVVKLPNASHYVFRSNEVEVVRAMNAFMDGLH